MLPAVVGMDAEWAGPLLVDAAAKEDAAVAEDVAGDVASADAARSVAVEHQPAARHPPAPVAAQRPAPRGARGGLHPLKEGGTIATNLSTHRHPCTIILKAHQLAIYNIQI